MKNTFFLIVVESNVVNVVQIMDIYVCRIYYRIRGVDVRVYLDICCICSCVI
jgi:hypothetical protein